MSSIHHERIKPCPKCKSSDVGGNQYNEYVMIDCFSCGFRGPKTDQGGYKEAIRMWSAQTS